MAVEQNINIAKQHAKDAGLRYVYDSDPGYGRKRRGKGFSYQGPDGKTVREALHIERFRKLAVPPAWENVWICLHANGHIQATGKDERGRKQYRYHEDWRSARDRTKFENMLEFGRALPSIRGKVFRALNQEGLPRDKVIAAIIRLLDRTGLRVGNDSYTEENHTFGITTIAKKHVELHGKEIELDFPAKGGKIWKGTFTDPKVAKIISDLEDIPGYRLFRFLDESGQPHAVSSGDVNQWLHDHTKASITAKDFRTWNACTLFLEEAIAQTGCCEGRALHLKPVLKAVADKLGNTPAILKKSYIHPELVDLYRTGCMEGKDWEPGDTPDGMKKTEALLLRWLERHYG